MSNNNKTPKRGFHKARGFGRDKRGFQNHDRGFDKAHGFGRDKDPDDQPMTTLLNPADQDCPRAWRKLFR